MMFSRTWYVIYIYLYGYVNMTAPQIVRHYSPHQNLNDMFYDITARLQCWYYIWCTTLNVSFFCDFPNPQVNHPWSWWGYFLSPMYSLNNLKDAFLFLNTPTFSSRKMGMQAILLILLWRNIKPLEPKPLLLMLFSVPLRNIAIITTVP